MDGSYIGDVNSCHPVHHFGHLEKHIDQDIIVRIVMQLKRVVTNHWLGKLLFFPKRMTFIKIVGGGSSCLRILVADLHQYQGYD